MHNEAHAMKDDWTSTDTHICWFIGSIATYMIGPAVPVMLFVVLVAELTVATVCNVCNIYNDDNGNPEQ